MSRSGGRIQNRRNAVVKRIEAGNGKVAGLRLLASVDDTALMPVEVVGLRFGGKYDGVKVVVKPVGGHGQLSVTPTALLDDTPEAVDLFERKGKAQERYEAVRSARSDRQRRSLIVDMRAEMTAAQRKEFDGRLPDRVGEKAVADPVAALNKLSGEYECQRVAELAAKVLFGVIDGPEYDD